MIVRRNEKKALKYSKLYHSEGNSKRKELYLKLLIKYSVAFERDEKDEKSF
tara:strand:- start:2608 stop:2760 length:153 start_codon:yes stop_codon:yes gene_type:complete